MFLAARRTMFFPIHLLHSYIHPSYKWTLPRGSEQACLHEPLLAELCRHLSFGPVTRLILRRRQAAYRTINCPKFFTIKNNITPYGMERISEWSSILLISHCSRFSQRSKMALFLMSLCVHRRYPSMLFLMVPQERLELSRLATMASKTIVSTIPPPGQNMLSVFNEQCCV